MTMGSLFGSAYAEQDYASQNPGDIPYDPYAYLEPEEDPYAPLNPNRGGFRDPVYNPANVAPGGQYAPNPDYGVFTPFHPINEVISPYLQTASDYLSEGGAAGLSALADIQSLSSGGYGTGYSGPEAASAAGSFIGSAIVPQSVEEAIINSSFGGGITGYDDLFRGAAAVRGGVGDVIRAGKPESQLYPGLGSSGGGYDYLRYLKENAAEAVDPRYPLPIDPLDPITQARAARAGPGYIEGGTTPGIIDSIEQAHPPNVAGYGQPVAIEGGRAFPAGGFPDNVIPEAPLPSRLDVLSGAPPIETPSQVGEIVRGAGGRSSITAPDGSRIEWRNTDEGAHIL